jgi:hypothetical protein
MTTRHSTGMSLLDRELNGGVPPGSMIALVAPPDIQTDPVLHGMARERPTVLGTTVRPAAEVTADYETVAPEVEVVELGPDELTDLHTPLVGEVGEEWTVLVDPIDGLERAEREPYLAFLNALKQRLVETGSVGLVRCAEGYGDHPPNRRETLERADLVWRLEQEVGRQVETQLLVTKFRGGAALVDPIDVELTDDITIDTSRDIG